MLRSMKCLVLRRKDVMEICDRKEEMVICDSNGNKKEEMEICEQKLQRVDVNKRDVWIFEVVSGIVV